MGSAMASMPHYMSQGVNELAASGVKRPSTASCLCSSSASPASKRSWSLHQPAHLNLRLPYHSRRQREFARALKVAEDVTHFLNKTLGEIGTDIQRMSKPSG
jgi:hypothetical protein